MERRESDHSSPLLAPIPPVVDVAPCDFNSLSCLSYLADPSMHVTSLRVVQPCQWSAEEAAAALHAAALPLARDAATGRTVTTPLVASKWAALLCNTKYDPSRSIQLVKWLRIGVPVGYSGPRDRVQQCSNLRSADEQHAAVDASMAKEAALGARIGPFDPGGPLPWKHYRLSPLGTVPKRAGADGIPQHRVIHHLSWPRGDSINDSITARSVQLTGFDKMMRMVRALGAGCWLFKVDISNAYKCIPVCPADWPLLGMQWNGSLFWEIALPFGLASSCLVFEAFTTAANHMCSARTRMLLALIEHYIDDFVGGAKSRAVAQRALAIVVALLEELGFPIAAAKTEGPSQRISILGLLVDTVSMTASLPADKLLALRQLVAEWLTYKHYSRKQLEQLVGTLQFASLVVRQSRPFMSRLYHSLCGIERRGVRTLTAQSELLLDLHWWRDYAAEWNGVSLLPPTREHTVTLTTDACQTGFGAECGNDWLHGTWSAADLAEAQRQLTLSMPFLEFKALCIAAVSWGDKWRGHSVLFRCDCDAVVKAVQRGGSSAPSMARLVRVLAFIAVRCRFDYRIEHIAGADNISADLLSRGRIQEFRAYRPDANPLPTIPSALPSLTW